MLNCDFCGKSQNDVKRIIVGRNGVAICDSCVLSSVEVLIDNGAELKLSQEPEPVSINYDDKYIKKILVPNICDKCNTLMEMNEISKERKKDGITTIQHKCKRCGNEKIERYKI